MTIFVEIDSAILYKGAEIRQHLVKGASEPFR
jgi:hypothetical protein